MKVINRVLRPILGPRLFDALDFNLKYRTCRGVYRTFHDARAAIPKGYVVGYDNERSARSYLGRAEDPAPSDYAVLFWIQPVLSEIREVFDFGGNIGPTYHSYAKVVTYPSDLRWTVCDLPAVVKEGRRMAIERGASNLHFTTEFQDAEGCDLFLTRGALQYTEDDLGLMLGGLREKPRHVLVNRVPLSDQPTYVTIQNIGSALSPYRIQNRTEFVESMERAGYRLVDSWNCPDVRLVVRDGLRLRLMMHYSGMYLRLEE